MRLLILSPEFPLPAANATRHKIFHLLRFLSAEHEVSLLAFHEPGDPPSQDRLAGVLETGCRDVAVFPWRRDPFLRDALASVLELVPHAYRKFRSELFQEQLRLLVRQQRFDVVHCDINLTEMRDFLTGREATVVSPSDSFTKMMLRMSRSALGGFRKTYALSQALKFWYAERFLYPRFTKCHVVSRQEADFLRRINRKIDTAVVPIGADVPPTCASESLRRPGVSLAMSGQMSNPFTVDGILWFRQKVWPRVKFEVPDARLYLIGRSPDPRLEALAQEDPRIIVTGYVEEMAASLRDKMVYVCPLQYGAGLKTRLIEAMANGIPCVTTPIGAEGLEIVSGRHALIAASAEDFARAVVELLRSQALRERLAVAAHALMGSCYTWKAYAAGMEANYMEAIEKHRTLGEAIEGS